MTEKKEEKLRLDRYLCECMGITRSEAKGLLSRGQVTVGGVVCKKGDAHVGDADAVTAAGKLLQRQKYVYIMLDKPQGVVSAGEDGRDTTVVDLVREFFPRRQLFPAGRLDKDSTGFVLLTDDGAFAHDILAPKRHVPKTYTVRIDVPVTQQMVDGFAAGITLADGSCMQPAVLQPVEGDATLGRVVLTQGVYHQIKRMFGTFGAGVVSLRRTAIGGLVLDETLGAGGWRELSEEEVKKITDHFSPDFQKTATFSC